MGNRLVEVRSADETPVVRYLHDVYGRRVLRWDMATGEQTRFIYDGWQVIEERNGSGEVAVAYVYSDLENQSIPCLRHGLPVAGD